LNTEEEASKAPGKAGPQVPFPFSLLHAYIAFTRTELAESSLILVFTWSFYASFLPFFLKIPAAGDMHKILVIRLFFLLGFTVQETENKEYFQLRL